MYQTDPLSHGKPVDLTPEVEALGQLHLEGNIIPHTWYQYIKLDTGKPDVISIILLADIVYWYRPSYIRDIATGKIISVKKKFSGDALQKSKKDLAEQFGFTEKQVQESLARLEFHGLISRDLRIVDSQFGKVGNVQFIKIHPERIVAISNISSKVTPLEKFIHSPPPYGEIPPEGWKNFSSTLPYNYTKTTTENKTTTPTPSSPKKPAAKPKPEDSSSSFFKCLEKYKMPVNDKQRLSKQFPEELVCRAASYIDSSSMRPRKGLVACFFHFCNNPEHMITENDVQKQQQQQKDAEQELIAKKKAIAEDVEKRVRNGVIKSGQKWQRPIYVTHDYIEFSNDREVLKIYYTEKDFKKLVKHILDKFDLTKYLN